MTTDVINKLSFKILAAVVLSLICSIAMAAPETVLSAVEQGLASGQFSKDDLSLLTQIQITKSINTVIYCGMTLIACFIAGGFLSEKTGVIVATLLALIVFGAGALQLVRKTMNTSFIRAVMIHKAGFGIGPALGAMEEFLELYKDKLPDIAKPVLLDREPIGSEE